MPSARRSRPIVVTEVGRSATGRDSRISFLVTYTGRSVPSSARQRLTALFLTCSRRFLIFTVSGAETAAACGCVGGIKVPALYFFTTSPTTAAFCGRGIFRPEGWVGSLGGACRTSRYSAFRPSRRCWYLLCTALSGKSCVPFRSKNLF